MPAITVLPVCLSHPIYWVRDGQTTANGPYPACCLFLGGCELRMVFTILNGWGKKQKNNICDSGNDMKFKVQGL